MVSQPLKCHSNFLGTYTDIYIHINDTSPGHITLAHKKSLQNHKKMQNVDIGMVTTEYGQMKSELI